MNTYRITYAATEVSNTWVDAEDEESARAEFEDHGGWETEFVEYADEPAVILYVEDVTETIPLTATPSGPPLYPYCADGCGSRLVFDPADDILVHAFGAAARCAGDSCIIYFRTEPDQ